MTSLFVFFCFLFFTGVYLGCSLNLDPLQLSEARRLCWNQIRRSDKRRFPHSIFFGTELFLSYWFILRSLTIPREPVQWRGAQVKEHNRVREEETERFKTEERQMLCIDPPKVKNTSHNFKILSEIIRKAVFFWDSTKISFICTVYLYKTNR